MRDRQKNPEQVPNKHPKKPLFTSQNPSKAVKSSQIQSKPVTAGKQHTIF
jgi:hypothetical protein